jgi:decaprenylphospho-beta-D-erythro-pentofuranosid-2-ulose 2-reductase
MSRRVLILGATSAIAAEAAALYAARGDRLCLVGRNPTKLAALVDRLAAARPIAIQADFDDLDRNASVVASALAALAGCDIALIAHGLLGDQLATERDFSEAERIIRTNFTSVVSLLVPLANHAELARGGRLGVMTSVAGERGRPRNYTYGACKGALNLYLQGVRSRLYPAGVSVTALKLGPVDTPMTATHTKNALFGQPASVARAIVAAVDDRRDEAFVPWYWSAIMPVVRHTPEALFQKLRFLSGR